MTWIILGVLSLVLFAWVVCRYAVRETKGDIAALRAAVIEREYEHQRDEDRAAVTYVEDYLRSKRQP